MDGTTAGAIMVGSGSLGSSFSSLANSSSPTNYTIPAGFTPPINTGSAGSAPWTVTCASGSNLCDNGPSRMNMTKKALRDVLTNYGSTLNFGLIDYDVTGVTTYSTWVYYMSPTTGPFIFTNTAAATGSLRTVPNPCYGYSTASSSVSSPCGSIAAQYGSGKVAGNMYMVVGASSDDPLINDVLYAPASYITAEMLTYGGASPANPYPPATGSYPLKTYNTNIGSYAETYSQDAPSQRLPWFTTPTNAGYVPFSNQVLYSQRGFGYNISSQVATDGHLEVAMGADPTTGFTTALLPESNNASTKEIKSSATQASTYGLMAYAKTYLQGLTKTTCQTQFVVLMTDGLPTLDKKGSAWPPLGTTTALAYGLGATYNTDGSFASSSSDAVTDAINAITALSSAGIKVFVIGLGAGVDPTNNTQAAALLKAMAIAGGTSNFYAATDSASLSAAFLTVVDIIYKSSAVAAPVAPISVAGGTSFEYELTSIATPASGHVQAYAVAASGVASSVASWDAGDPTHMSTTSRSTALSAANASGAVVPLSGVDAAAFNLPSPAPTCVPNVATIISYTVDPSYSGGPSGCSYLGARQSGWPLGAFSTQNTGHFMGPPQSAYLSGHYASYAAYASTLSGRTSSVLFTDSDGFLYSVNASTGLLQWGWTSRSILAQLQNYSTFSAGGWTNGGFAVVDAPNSSGTWGTYIVGSLQSGAEHYSLALDSSGTATSGTPTSVVYDTVISGGSSAGDQAGATGATPLRQPAVIAYVNNITTGNAYHVYVVTVGGTSTLYESDVTSSTGTTSASLGFKVTSDITLDASSNLLWMGGSDGTVRSVRISGVASDDVGTLTTVATVTTPPSTSSPTANVLYVGYVTVAGIPYIYAVNSAQITVFGVSSSGWVPLWATTPTQGYTYDSTTVPNKWNASAAVTLMTSSSVVSDVPIQVGISLLIPTYVAGSACTAGTGYYDFFNFADGTFPTATNLTYNGTPVTSDMYVGLGAAFTPSLTAIAGGLALNPQTFGNPLPPPGPISSKGGVGPRAIAWTQH